MKLEYREPLPTGTACDSRRAAASDSRFAIDILGFVPVLPDDPRLLPRLLSGKNTAISLCCVGIN